MMEMVLLHHHHPVFRSSPLFLKRPIQVHPPLHNASLRRHHRLSINCISQNPFQSSQSLPKTPKPKTLFPSGFKRPEIQVPSLVLQLDAADLLDADPPLDLIDAALSKWVRIVLLNSRELGGGGGKLYEAACKLKSLLADRAYLLIADRVDIATAVSASGVVLSDQGLPPIVARSTMMDSISDSVFLPLVGRNVKSLVSAINASKSEGADFLLYNLDEEKLDMTTDSVFKNVKIPIFVLSSSYGENTTFIEALKWLELGASGLVIPLQGLRLLSDDVVSKSFDSIFAKNGRKEDGTSGLLSMDNGTLGTTQVTGFVNLEDREKQVIEIEKVVLREAINIIQKAAPLMEEVSLLKDSVSQIDEPFMLAIVGEFNSGKSTVINALLGRRYLKDGVVPTTNEITFLRFSELNPNEERCERHPDGQYICYLPAPILNEMNIVDTPGTNVILERQQLLTEEFVPRADLLLFVISADRPLTESEVSFLRYTQQWKKKVVFVLNKSDLYQNSHELEEALSFVKENAAKLLNTEHVSVFPVSARSALESKLSASLDTGEVLSSSNSCWRSSSFEDLENFLYSFLDGSTSNGMERMKLKLQTPVSIAERLLSAAEILVRQDIRFAKQDLASLDELIDSVRNYRTKMESEGIAWRRQALSLIDSTQSRITKLVDYTLRLSNFDIAAYYVLKGGEKTTTLSATSKIQNDIISPAIFDAQKLLQDYESWLQSGNAREGIVYQESLQKLWPSIIFPATQMQFETCELLKKLDDQSLKVIKNFSPIAASKLFDQEIRETFLGTFGGLGAAGFSASLLTSVLSTTTEDLLALGLCSAGGFLAISNFPSRRQQLKSKVKRTADGFAQELEAAMQEDLNEAVRNLEAFVSVISKPYRDEAQNRLDKLLEIQDELSNVGKKLQKLQNEIQNIHMSN